MAEKGYRTVTISQDDMNAWEEMKTMFINHVRYDIPVDIPTPVPNNVADVIEEWQATNRRIKKEREKRQADLSK